MTWLDIVGAIGGSAGIVALIKVGIDVFFAKSNKTTVDIKNMQEMLNESHRLFNDVVSKYKTLEEKIEKDRTASHTYIESLRKRIEESEANYRTLDGRINKLEKVVNVAWRCKYPQDIADCPVIQKYEKLHLCDGCEHKEEA
jgi:uncharacterized protein YaaN involved in tellurite resistance